MIRRKMTGLKNKEAGTAVVIVALAMAVLFGIAALVIDVGVLFVTRAELMDTADAAALAGAQELLVSEVQAKETAEEYIEENGFEVSEFTVNTADEGTVTVTGSRTEDMFFARVLGITESSVGAEATAQIQGVTAVKGVAPLGIEDQTLTKETLYTLKVGAPPEENAGNFGALAIGGPGANIYRENLKYGSDEEVSKGDILDTETGNISGPTKQAVDSLMQRCDHVPECTIDCYERDCPRIIIIPIYEPYEKEQNLLQKVKVVGFGAFLVDGHVEQGNESYVRGYFIDQIVPGESEADASQGSYGAHTVRLIE